MDNKLYDVLTLLSQDDFQTSQELADKLGVSEKTVRTRIKELKDSLTNYGAEILSKRHFGYKLMVHENALFIKVSRSSEGNDIPETSEERLSYY